MQRVNWIDWVKAWCMTVVVFCHLPQQEDAFHLQYLSSVILSSFFFVSGYLKKPLVSLKESMKKYTYSLLIPYLIYNIIYYPYWFGKYYIEHGGLSIRDCFKPIIGTLFLQLNTVFSCELNGVTWFLISIFIMHWITDLCNRQKKGIIWMFVISIVAILLYGANKYYHYAPYLPFHGLVRNIPFFFIGNQLRNSYLFKKVCIKKNLLYGASMLLLSILLFYWHIHEYNFVMHILLYFIVNILSIFAFVHLFLILDNIRIPLIITMSYGTMVIFGLHRILIGIIDYGMEKALSINDIYYEWYEALSITIIICALLYPVILFGKKYAPILIGKSQYNNLGD